MLGAHSYIGRFAPSPTGKLHFGSLTTAVASYVDAKANQGQWLVRMEDLDPPREEAGAADSILRSLEAHHLHWDQTVLYQSHRLDAYQAALEQLAQFIYPCSCTRQRIQALPAGYDGYCRVHPPSATGNLAWRLRIDTLADEDRQAAETLDDIFLGHQLLPLDANGDFIVKRKDGLFAYQLAVAVDDIFQQITHVIRGVDLLDSTSRQLYLMRLLGYSSPAYGHTPLALGTDGHKLSKQTKATPLSDRHAAKNLTAALCFLGHQPPDDQIASDCCESLLDWATVNWKRQQVPVSASVAPLLPGA